MTQRTHPSVTIFADSPCVGGNTGYSRAWPFTDPPCGGGNTGYSRAWLFTDSPCVGGNTGYSRAWPFTDPPCGGGNTGYTRAWLFTDSPCVGGNTGCGAAVAGRGARGASTANRNADDWQADAGLEHTADWLSMTAYKPQQLPVVLRIVKGCIALYGKPTAELRSVTCHMGSHSVPANRHRWMCPTLTPTKQASTWFTHPREMVDLGWLHGLPLARQ